MFSEELQGLSPCYLSQNVLLELHRNVAKGKDVNYFKNIYISA